MPSRLCAHVVKLVGHDNMIVMVQGAGCDQLWTLFWLVAGKVIIIIGNQHHQLSGFNWSRVCYILEISSFHLVQFCFLLKQECVLILCLYLSGKCGFHDSAVWQIYILICSPAQQLFFVVTYSYFPIINSRVNLLLQRQGHRSLYTVSIAPG